MSQMINVSGTWQIDIFSNGINSPLASKRLLDHPEWSQNPNLDCNCCLRMGGHFQKLPDQ
jgi:hypothetical protein